MSRLGAVSLLVRDYDEALAFYVGKLGFDQAGGRVWLFLETDDFARDHAAFTAAGVRFREAPRHEGYGKVAVFEDLYGNAWDLIEPARTGD